jgi:RNA polymerase sigma factor (sigma-70 family)
MNPKEQVLALAAGIYESRGGDLLRYLKHRFCSEADARDIAQEAFLRFIRLSEPERVKNPEAYIFRIAGNLLWEQRLRKREQSGQSSEVESTVVEHTPFDLASAGQSAARLRAALDILPPMQRAVLILHLRDGLSFADIAVHSGISNTMAKKHFKKALAACQHCLREYRQAERLAP